MNVELTLTLQLELIELSKLLVKQERTAGWFKKGNVIETRNVGIGSLGSPNLNKC